jgi:hypothetical protein
MRTRSMSSAIPPAPLTATDQHHAVPRAGTESTSLGRTMGLGDGLNERQGALLDRVGGATAGRFIDLEKAEAVLAESQRRRRMSLGWWVGGDGITRCRS